jgi:replicative DNA helicase
MEREWEDGALYTALWGQAEDVFSILTPDDFGSTNARELAELIHRGIVEGQDSMTQWVRDESVRTGRPSPKYVAEIVAAGFTGSGRYYATKIKELSLLRQAEVAITRAKQKINNMLDPVLIIEELRADLDAIPSPQTSNDDTWTLADIMGLNVEDKLFTIPGMMQRNERLVLTGSEGGGKSVFVYQLLTGAAFGVDTMTLERHDPQRVLFLDVENNEVQARANLDKIVPVLQEMAPDVSPEWRSMKRRVVNLLDTRDRADVIRRIVHYSPDILYMGTAYKLTDISDDTHRSVRAIQSVVDRIREEIDCTVVVEHHAGHGFNNDRNGMRPEGSSYWLRWPDFGYGMQPQQSSTGRLMRLRPWRGDRVTGRKFPVALKSGNLLPWKPIYEDEWESVYSHLDN